MANDLGIISPNIITKTVSIPVAIPVIRLAEFEKPDFLAIFIANVVVSYDAERFTILFPISIALNILVGFSQSFKTNAAFLLPSSAIDLRRIWFAVVRQVSAEEKNAERTSKISNIISFEASPESKKINSNRLIFV